MSSDKTPKTKTKGGIPYRSKLVPYGQQIALWQREGKTYREMSALLKEQGVQAHHDTINAFVLSRVRGRKRAILPAEYLTGEEIVAPPIPAAASAAPRQPFTPFQPATPVAGQSVKTTKTAKKAIDSSGKAVSPPYAPVKASDL